MPADIDRQFERFNLPDHGNLLANVVRWAAKESISLTVDGPGLVDCNVYQQPGRLVVHLVNLTSAATWRAPLDEFISIGPLRVRVRLPDGVNGRRSQLLVSNQKSPLATKDGWCQFEVPSVLDHEVIVIA